MISLRTFIHYRLYSTINLLGLALSLTCVVIIARYVYSELTVDGFNTKMDRIFITATESSNNQGKQSFSGIFNPNREKNFVDISEHPGVEKHTLFVPVPEHKIALDNQEYNVRPYAIDSVFLQILDYPVIAGAKNIRRPEDVFLTEALATKIFGTEDPVGKTLSYTAVNKTVTVAGIIRAPANKSVLQFDMLVNSALNDHWGRMPQSLLLLYPGIDYRELNDRHSDFMEMSRWGYSIRYSLFPYKDVYYSKHISDYGTFLHGNAVYVFVLLGIGILLLLIGLINYINIHSVVMMRR